jgi:glycosyltransferase involved in cell wall biosynthesis
MGSVMGSVRLAFLADGKSVHIKRWLDQFLDRGYEVHLITFTGKPVGEAQIHKLPYFGKLAYPLRIWSVRNAIKRINPDILHAHYISTYGVYAAFSGFHPLVLSTWGDDIDTDPERSRIIRSFVKFALRRADLVHTGDEIGKERLIELGCASRKILAQNWGVDTNLFSPTARSEPLRKSLGIDHSYSVVCARWWSLEYHVDVLIKAIPLVLRKIPNVKFILLGGGVLENRLKDSARKLGVYENTLFVGKVPPEEMPMYLASFDVYVDTVTDYTTRGSGDGPARRGGGGMGQTTTQTMACGIPQVLSNHLSVRLAKWFNGLMYEQSNPYDLAEKIVQLLADAKLRRRIGEESRRTILQTSDLEKTMKEWQTIYDRLKDSSRHKSAT